MPDRLSWPATNETIFACSPTSLTLISHARMEIGGERLGDSGGRGLGRACSRLGRQCNDEKWRRISLLRSRDILTFDAFSRRDFSAYYCPARARADRSYKCLGGMSGVG